MTTSTALAMRRVFPAFCSSLMLSIVIWFIFCTKPVASSLIENGRVASHFFRVMKIAMCISFSSQRMHSIVLRWSRYLNLHTTAQRYYRTCKSLIFVDSVSVYLLCSFSIVENIKNINNNTNGLTINMDKITTYNYEFFYFISRLYLNIYNFQTVNFNYHALRLIYF